jgi:hypothetical protein
VRYALMGAAAVAAAAFATPALAQAVIDDPGYCAQYHPNANCQNLGPGNPYTAASRGTTGTAATLRWFTTGIGVITGTRAEP